MFHVLSLITRISARDILITSANVKISLTTLTTPAMSGLCFLMRMALAAFRSASDRHFVRSCQSSCAVKRSRHRAARPNPIDLPALSVQHKAKSLVCDLHQTENSREIVWPPRFLYLVSKFGRNHTTSSTGFASVAPVRMDRTETPTRNFFTSEISQCIVKQSSVELVFGRRRHQSRSDRTSQRSEPVLVSDVLHKETQLFYTIVSSLISMIIETGTVSVRFDW